MSNERFELLKRLGQGAFAATWRARVLSPDVAQFFGSDEVALKIPHDDAKELVLRSELDVNAALHARLRGLNSAHLVRYLGVDVHQGRLVMVLEFVRGGDLRSRLKQAPGK